MTLSKGISPFNRLASLEVGAFLLTSISLSSCISCSNDVLSAVASPDGKAKAVVFDRNCGATTGHNVQVSIIPATQTLPDDSGNVFIEVQNTRAVPPIDVHWKSNEELVIVHQRFDTIFLENRKVNVMVGFLQWRTISITYEIEGAKESSKPIEES
jgi:hypothetical protein